MSYDGFWLSWSICNSESLSLFSLEMRNWAVSFPLSLSLLLTCTSLVILGSINFLLHIHILTLIIYQHGIPELDLHLKPGDWEELQIRQDQWIETRFQISTISTTAATITIRLHSLNPHLLQQRRKFKSIPKINIYSKGKVKLIRILRLTVQSIYHKIMIQSPDIKMEMMMQGMGIDNRLYLLFWDLILPFLEEVKIIQVVQVERR